MKDHYSEHHTAKFELFLNSSGVEGLRERFKVRVLGSFLTYLSRTFLMMALIYLIYFCS